MPWTENDIILRDITNKIQQMGGNWNYDITANTSNGEINYFPLRLEK